VFYRVRQGHIVKANILLFYEMTYLSIDNLGGEEGAISSHYLRGRQPLFEQLKKVMAISIPEIWMNLSEMYR